MQKWLLSSAFVLALVPTYGCGGALATSDSSTAADSADTADLTTSLSALTTDGVDMTAASDGAAATTAATRVKTLLQPSSCITVTTAVNVNTYTFAGCTGPYGLVSVNGTLTATYTKAGNAITVVLASQNLTANGAKLTLQATSVVSGTGTSRTATVNSSSSATTARGGQVAHTGSYTASWDGSCVSLDGAFTTRVGLISWATVVAGYKRCQNSCPQSGTVSISANNGSATVVNFNGSASATYTTSDGKVGSFMLGCGG